VSSMDRRFIPLPICQIVKFYLKNPSHLNCEKRYTVDRLNSSPKFGSGGFRCQKNSLAVCSEYDLEQYRYVPYRRRFRVGLEHTAITFETKLVFIVTCHFPRSANRRSREYFGDSAVMP
jgi:hypothetical protein